MQHIHASRQRVTAVDRYARTSHRRADGAWFLDFGRAWFATPVGTIPENIQVEMGEVLNDAESLDAQPGGSRRYRLLPWFAGVKVLALPRDGRNTRFPAVLVPDGLPEVMPIRALVIHGWPADAGDPAEHIQLRSLVWPFLHEGSWQSSSTILDAVDELCRHTMEATSFLGIYVDGDRERIAYEGDALINMLGHFVCDAAPQMAAATIEHLLCHPTWPAEWHLQLPCCAWEYLLASGDHDFIRAHATALEAHGLGALQTADGWLDTSKGPQDADFLASIAMAAPISYLIDWPLNERDESDCGHRLVAVNAWFVRAQSDLAKAFAACGLALAAARCAQRAEVARSALIRDCWDEQRGRFVDAPGSSHTSLHASAFALACDVFAEDDRRAQRAASWLAERGMCCSVYAAQHLIEALFRYGQSQAALQLLQATGPRSWHGMLEQGATMCMEAWDNASKPNQDWNHAWGGAPANLLPRWLAGIRPTAPGWRTAVINPRPGSLSAFQCAVPTPHGPIRVEWNVHNEPALRYTAPPEISLTVIEPQTANN